MTAPQITLLVLFLIALLLSANKHGQPKKGNHNFFGTLFAVFLWIVILYWGNFF
jgi:hypothetical protein